MYNYLFNVMFLQPNDPDGQVQLFLIQWVSLYKDASFYLKTHKNYELI